MILSSALKSGLKQAFLHERLDDIKAEDLGDIRFVVELLGEGRFSVVGKKDQGYELLEEIVPRRELRKEDIMKKIDQGKRFLLRMENTKEHGFYKFYNAKDDSFENRLHTPYSASIIYTLLYLHDLRKDKDISERLPEWGRFLLSMQNQEEGGKRYGAFHYSYFYDRREKEKRYVVGTSALSVFSLLRLYEKTGQEEYLNSAKLAGDWLLTMQREDGIMKPYVRYDGTRWVYGTKESLLYNGQCLSAFSKLYLATGEQRYLQAGERIAQHFALKYEKAKGYVEGEYRAKNPISNAWIVMSLIDFYRANPDPRYEKVIFELSSLILENQRDDPDDILFYGGWRGAYSSSGIGWIAEVMAETFRFCRERGGEDCDKYKEGVVKAIRWLFQNTYEEETAFLAKNPQRADGGIFWNKEERYIRTDSVCHALNAYIRIYQFLDDGLLISVPETPFEKTLEGIRR